ncbi:MAG: hypothetical protein FD123_3623 [Bacteroidetes bacterium]|nr:MAG: hypothetical protein FD123_3623 [Bacteroidota bacterium]
MKSFLLSLFLLFAFLPGQAQVRLLAFEGEQLGSGIRISWTIGSGNTCQDLEIQHSADGVNFTQIYLYPGVCGNAGFDQSYNYTHTTPEKNASNYYRINAQTGVISEILSIRFITYGTLGYTLFPQPASGSANMLIDNPNSEKIILELFDLSGKKSGATFETTGGQLLITQPAEGPGMYIFRITRETGDPVTGKIIFL